MVAEVTYISAVSKATASLTDGDFFVVSGLGVLVGMSADFPNVLEDEDDPRVPDWVMNLC